MRQTQKPRIVNLLMLTVAGMINAFGITLFMTPVKLYDSGISGTSMLLEQITPSYLSLSLFLLILNVPLFLVGLKKQGGLFTFYAIYTVGIYSLVAWLITDIFPIDVSIASPLAGTDLLLCALFGGVISGIGSGITRVSAKGGYSNRDKAMLYFVVNRYQVIRMKDIVHDIDPAAFIIISEVADIFSSNNE